MSIRHEQAYNWFTNPRFKLKTKTCGKRDISGRRGLFHIDRVQVVEFSRKWRRKLNVLVQQILFSQRSECHLSEGCVCVSNKHSYPTWVAAHLKSVMSCEQVCHWGVISSLETFIHKNVFFCHCDVVSLISRPCCCSWALSSALSFFRSSICRTMDIQHITTCPIGLGQ